MYSVDDRIVTAKSLRRPATGASEAVAPKASLAQTPEGRLRIAKYNQIVDRLEQETEDTGEGVMITVQDREVSLAQSKMAELAPRKEPLPSGGQEVKFGDGIGGMDWFGWVWSLTDHISRKDAHSIKRPSGAVADSIGNTLKVAIVADWGTGLYGAPKIAATIRRQAATAPYDLLMHLGDIYYSGTEQEVKDRFLGPWPAAAGAINRALNGNHEMYSGGFGYFDLILPKFNQACSYFAFQNDNWLFAGLDTAYVDHDMDADQVAWLNLLIADAGKRRVVLFSHQQPFSMLSDQGPKLQTALRRHLEDGRITAWYWGHEHDCVVYDKHPTWGLFGRCLGNGGIPSPRQDRVKSAADDAKEKAAKECRWKRFDASADSPSCLVLDGPNRDMALPSDQEKFGPHGFMTLDFNGATLVERVLLSDGTKLYENQI